MFSIQYAGVSDTGRIRHTNEDNFWCAGTMLPEKNNGTQEILSGELMEQEGLKCVAVFDGMGGEACGETAAFLAAATLDQKSEYHADNWYRDMNERICDYAKENRIRHMGTTAGMICFEENMASISNIGDSKIYMYQDGQIRQISHDHVHRASWLYKKPPLTQCLGIPAEEYVIEPYTTREKLYSGQYFVLCTDGVSDMLSMEEIGHIIEDRKWPIDIVDRVKDMVLYRGAVDNFTIFVLKVKGDLEDE